jgi:hypothetical protein
VAAWLAAAIRHPERVRRLVVPTPHPDAGRASARRERLLVRTAFQIPLLPEWLSRLRLAV